MRQRSSSYILNAATIIFPFQTQWVPICSLLEIEPFALLMHKTPFAIQKVRSLTPLLILLPDWEGNATVSVFYNFENHHILKVTYSSLQSVGDRTFCIGQTQSSVFNIGAESYAEGASGQPATTTTTTTAATTCFVWVELQKHSKALILSLILTKLISTQ